MTWLEMFLFTLCFVFQSFGPAATYHEQSSLCTLWVLRILEPQQNWVQYDYLWCVYPRDTALELHEDLASAVREKWTQVRHSTVMSSVYPLVLI